MTANAQWPGLPVHLKFLVLSYVLNLSHSDTHTVTLFFKMQFYMGIYDIKPLKMWKLQFQNTS